MPTTVTMPRLSDTMEAGTVIKWHVKEGDTVASGDVLADVETDKATMEMQAYDDGVVAKLLIGAGDRVAIGTPIAVIAVEGEDASSAGSAKPAAAAAPAPRAAASTDAPVAVTGTVVMPSAHADTGARARISPVARRMAEELGVDINSLRGTGPGGRVIKRDIEAAESRKGSGAVAAPASIMPAMPVVATPAPAAASSMPVVAGPGSREVAVSGMRQTIARRLVESKSTIPHYQVSMRFNMDPLLELRKMLNAQLEPQGVKLSVNDFIVRACALAMAQHPYFNASWAGDRIIIHGEVNVGVAVSLPAERGGGLVVAVIRNADQKGLRQISLDTRALAEKARTRGLGPEDMMGATFTISNLGMYGVDNFTAIINPPNSAILACGAAVERPVVRNSQLCVGTELDATLSLDHRVIDGAMAAEYLTTVRHNLENPATLLV
ncbi:MAG: 2-oxo acid dehydrogenase subunit E2 [Planctomycetes bacterium]|nr:2-oxo acid dehydrogenase subunit E2 [Planctomycetota bacterium]